MTDSLRIASLPADRLGGAIGVTFAPGEKQAHGMTGPHDRDLGADLDTIAAWGAAAVFILDSTRDNVGGQRRFIVRDRRRLTLDRAVLAQNLGGPPLGHACHRPNSIDAGPPASGAQSFPRAASVRITLSSVRSATARRRRWFSALELLEPLDLMSLSPPNSLSRNKRRDTCSYNKAR